LSNFKDRTTRVLVATDIAARGIDVDELTHVINYELPNIPETYVHRIGRTGRAGLSGIALSFCEAEELPLPERHSQAHRQGNSKRYQPSLSHRLFWF
jgi:superfamily II DNA/RNA helicase